MRPHKLLLSASVLVAGGVAFAALSPLTAQEEMPVMPSMAVDQHAMVVAGVGEWSGTIEMNMPGMPEPMISRCTEHVEALGELWTTAKFEMEMMPGVPFTGMATFGYDTTKDKFVGTWIDSISPVMSLMEGDYDEEKGGIVMRYDMYDVEAQTVKKMRNEQVRTDDSYVMHFFEETADGDVQTMVIKMSRKGEREAEGSR